MKTRKYAAPAVKGLTLLMFLLHLRDLLWKSYHYWWFIYFRDQLWSSYHWWYLGRALCVEGLWCCCSLRRVDVIYQMLLKTCKTHRGSVLMSPPAKMTIANNSCYSDFATGKGCTFTVHAIYSQVVDQGQWLRLRSSNLDSKIKTVVLRQNCLKKCYKLLLNYDICY